MSVFKNQCQDSWKKYSNLKRIGKILPKSTPLRIATIAGSYKDLLHANNGNNGIDSVLRSIYDGSGKYTGIKISNNCTSISSDNIEISNPVNGSNIFFIKKIELNTTDSIVHNIKDSNHIMLTYTGDISAYIEKNITILLDDLFSFQSAQVDEFIVSQLHFHCSSSSFLPINISIKLSLDGYELQSQVFEIDEEKTFFSKSFLIMSNKITANKIEIMDLENAELL